MTDGSQLVPEGVGVVPNGLLHNLCEALTIGWKKRAEEALDRIASRRPLLTNPITLHGLQKS